MSTRKLPEMQSQQISAGIILVGRAGLWFGGIWTTRDAIIKHTVDVILKCVVCMCGVQLTWSQAVEGVILHHANTLVIHRSCAWCTNRQPCLDFSHFQASPSSPAAHGVILISKPAHKARQLCNDLLSDWKPTESHENPRNPTKPHGIPRNLTESNDHGCYNMFFLELFFHEIFATGPCFMSRLLTYVSPYKWQVGVVWGMHAIPWGAGIPMNIKHVFMWCVSREPATCPHLMQGSLQKYHPQIE